MQQRRTAHAGNEDVRPRLGRTEPWVALTAFERTYFNDMFLVLDRLFVHRLRMVEGKAPIR